MDASLITWAVIFESARTQLGSRDLSQVVSLIVNLKLKTVLVLLRFSGRWTL
jgi:hypothetical protein